MRTLGARLVLTSLAGLALIGAAGPGDLEDLLWDLQIVPLDGPAAPAFALAGLDGQTMRLEALRGQPVILYFWHST